MDFDKEKIVEALRPIQMPGTSTDIVAAGGVRGVEVSGNKIHVEAVIFSPALNMRRKVENQIAYLLEKLYPQAEITARVGSEKPQDDPIAPVETSISRVRHIVAVASGKGGVGKSTVSANLAIALAQAGYRVGLVDADIYGPSMPIMFDCEDAMPAAVEVDGKDMMTPIEAYGVKLQSIGFFAKPDQAMAWRGAMATKALQQIIFETKWDELDYLLIDMPPGTGDVPLTVFQSLPVDGIIIVTTPQDLVTMIVKKAFNMAKMMNIPVLGLLENMSYVLCPDCGRQIKVFGESHIDETAKELGVPVLGRIPMEEKTAKLVDEGAAELVGDKYVKDAVEAIEKL